MGEIWEYGNFNKILIDELTSTSRDIIVDYAEIGMESIFADDIIKQIPILKTIAAFCNVGFAINERFFAKKVAVFIKQFHEKTVNEEKMGRFRTKLESDNKFKGKVMDHIIVMIDRYIDVEKSKIMALFLSGYINELCSLEQFIEISSTLDLVFLSDCEVLVNIYKKTGELPLDSPNKFINFEEETGRKIYSSIGRLRANGLISGRSIGRFGGGPENHLDVEAQITEFGILFCELGLL